MADKKKMPPAVIVGTSGEITNPEPKEGYSIWMEGGTWYTAPTVDPVKFGGHAYDNGGYEDGIRDCSCGTYMLSSSSGGPVDPFGACPHNLRTKKSTDKSNAEVARETVDSWHDMLKFPPIDYNDKERMKRNIESALTTCQSQLAKEVLESIKAVNEGRPYGNAGVKLNIVGVVRELFSRLGIEVDEGAE